MDISITARAAASPGGNLRTAGDADSRRDESTSRYGLYPLDERALWAQADRFSRDCVSVSRAPGVIDWFYLCTVWTFRQMSNIRMSDRVIVGCKPCTGDLEGSVGM